MRHRIVFVTSTDTGVGKTILTVALTRRLRLRGVDVATLKPFCSGGRTDALAIRRALDGRLALDQINPWHFAAPLAPRLAAAIEGQVVRRRDVVAHIRTVAACHPITLVEGAGGLLSPLAADGDASQFITALGATTVVVCPNRLGALNQTLLVLRALPRPAASQARIVLIAQRWPDESAQSNAEFLRGRLGAQRVFEFPWLSVADRSGTARQDDRIHPVLDAIIEG